MSIRIYAFTWVLHFKPFYYYLVLAARKCSCKPLCGIEKMEYSKNIRYILILLLAPLGLLAQDNYKSTFKPDSVLINNEITDANEVNSVLLFDQDNRVIIWDNGVDKVSILFSIKTKGEYVITKHRTEIFIDGEWKKPPLKFKHEGLRFIRINRWQGGSKSTKPSKLVKSSKAGFDVSKTYVGNNGDTIFLDGYFEYIKK